MQKHYLLLVLILLSQFLAAQSPKWVNYANDGTVWDILPTNEYVWISTQGGLERIDRATGQRKIFQASNSGLRGTAVSATNLAPDGKLWVSGKGAGLFRFDGADNWEQFYAINTGDTLIEIQDLEMTAAGKLWFISNVNNNCSGCTKLFHYDGTQFSEHTDIVVSALGNYGVRSIALDASGELWVNSALKIARFDGANVTDMAIPMLANEYIVNMAFDKDNTLWVGTYEDLPGSWNYTYRIRYFDGNSWAELDESTLGGDIIQVYKMFKDASGDFCISFSPQLSPSSAFAKFDGTSWQYTTLSDLPNLPISPKSFLYAIDSQDHYWFLEYAGRLLPMVYEFDGQNWKVHQTEIYPLADNAVYDVAFDCNNSTWFGGFDMLTKFDGLSWKNFTLQDMGINADYFAIWSLTADTTNCDVWISFYENNEDPTGFAKYDGNTFTKYTTPDEYDVFETAIAKDGTVWVASANAGLGKFDGNTWTWFDEQNSPVNNYLQSVTIDHAQNVWITTGFPVSLMRFDGSNWTKFDQNNAPLTDYSYWVFVDHAGMIWTGSETGLLRFDGLQWQSFPVPGTEARGITAMAQDQAHQFWIANKSGLHKWDGNTFESYNFIDDPIGAADIWRIRVDPFGNKWLMHNYGSGATVFNENGISNHVVNPTAGVQGAVFYDANQNGQQEPGSSEPGIPNEKV